MMSYLHTKFHENRISSFRGVAMTRFLDGRSDCTPRPAFAFGDAGKNWPITKTRGPWATSFTWETRSNQWIHFCKVMSIFIIKLSQGFSCRFLNFVKVLCILLLSLNVKRYGLSFWTNLNPLYTGMFLPSFVEIGPVVLEEKIFLNSSMYFCNFIIISIWKRVEPFTQGWFVLSLVEICPLVLEMMIFKLCRCIFSIS